MFKKNKNSNKITFHFDTVRFTMSKSIELSKTIFSKLNIGYHSLVL